VQMIQAAENCLPNRAKGLACSNAFKYLPFPRSLIDFFSFLRTHSHKARKQHIPSR